MADEAIEYFTSHAWRKITLISAIGIFGIGLYFLIRGILNGIIIWGLPLFIGNFVVGFSAIYYYMKSRYVPVAITGPNWIIIKQGSRNKKPFTTKCRIKEVKVIKKHVVSVRKGILSTTIGTIDGYRYFIYGLSDRDSESLRRNLSAR